MSKRGQNWSIEMIVTSALFITFFVTFLTFSFVANTDNLDEASATSDDIANRLLSNDDDVGVIGDDSSIDEDLWIRLARLPFEELQAYFGISADFCIIPEDEYGDVIIIDGRLGIGSPNILIDGHPCGAPYNP